MATAVPPTVRLRRAVIQAMPFAAMTLVVLLLAALLWLLHRNELEDERLVLIKDILWVEQNLHFHLTSDQEKLEQLAADLTHGAAKPSAFAVRARHILTNNPELGRIVWRDAENRLVVSVPPLDDPHNAAGSSAESATARAFARSMGKAVYTGRVALEGGLPGFEVHVPMFADGRFSGTLIGVFSLPSLLTHQVPWWIAERYQVTVIDGDGAVLASKSDLPAASSALSHQVRLDPPGHELALVATVYKRETNLARNILVAAIFGLAVTAVLSLWGLRRHMRRRVIAEQALRDEHAFRKAMEDSLTVGMRARDRDGRITYVNPAFCRMVGWPAEALVGAGPPMPYWLPEDLDRTLALHNAVLAGEAPAEGFELRFRRADDERFDALIYEAPLIDADGRHAGWMASVLDITERKKEAELARQQQEKLQQTSRLITMGEMASTLAHELSQPLSAIASYNTGCLNNLRGGTFEVPGMVTALERLGEQAQRAGHIIRRIHDFVRKSDPYLAPCAIDDVVRESMGFIAADARKRGVHIEMELSDGGALVLADRILIEQVLLNLARNAIEAMGQTPRGERMLKVGVSRADGMVAVAIADRGTGITPEAAAHLFSPFYTTKAEGMGMGLNICRSIVEFHRGRLWFEANAGGGSVFRFTLPGRP